MPDCRALSRLHAAQPARRRARCPVTPRPLPGTALPATVGEMAAAVASTLLARVTTERAGTARGANEADVPDGRSISLLTGAAVLVQTAMTALSLCPARGRRKSRTSVWDDCEWCLPMDLFTVGTTGRERPPLSPGAARSGWHHDLGPPRRGGPRRRSPACPAGRSTSPGDAPVCLRSTRTGNGG